MSNQWNLDKIYKGIEDTKYKNDLAKYIELGGVYTELINSIEGIPSVNDVESILKFQEDMYALIGNLFRYVGLRQAVETENGQLLAELNNLTRISSEYVGADAKAVKIIALIPSVDDYAKESEIINDYKALLKRTADAASHMLSDAEEELYAKMDMTGGSAFGSLQSFLTSTVTTPYNGTEITLTEARNLAYEKEESVRKEGYAAELKAYDKIADSVAYSLNNIKLQVNMISEKRGYESALDKALKDSYMTRETLDAMISAIEDHLPRLRRYFIHKSKLLGHDGPLPWHDLYAPLGSNNKKYTIDEAKEVLIKAFNEFTPDMSSLIDEAFTNEWIDFFPRSGKQGGAFDESVPSIKESRVMTNFDGNFSSIDTLAHELGHSFHDRQVMDNRPMNMDYPMQVAETASTFNETHLCSYYASKASDKGEKLALLEGLLVEQLACIVDIYSRYLFETSVFEKCEETFLMKEDLNKLMHEAQVKAYGEGLDESTMNPYMWCCKSHYYSSGLSFYNFPYAFGTLFAAGLYDMFIKEGAEKFVPKYKNMLSKTPTVSVEEAGALMGINLQDKAFWNASLEMIEKNIDEFIKL